MNYQKHYNLLMERARIREMATYTERHHIIPKCMGGLNNPENLVSLTPEEHYVAHQLLVKIYPEHKGLIFAANMMCVGTDRNNKRYGWVRKNIAEARRGTSLTDEAKKKISVKAKKRIEENGHPRGMLGKKHADTSKQLMSIRRTGENNYMYGKTHTLSALDKMRKPKTIEHRKKLALSKTGSNHPNFGKKLSEETRQKISNGVSLSARVRCPHCDKEGKKSPMSRWHFDQCKQRERT